jgi:hypothetical protein
MADTHRHDAQLHQHEHTHVTRYLRHGQQWERMDTGHDYEHNHAAVSHAPQPPGPRQGAWRGPHPRPRAASPIAAYADPCRRPGTGRCPGSPGPRAALTVWIRGSPQADIGSCEIEPPTSAVNYPGRAAPLGAALGPVIGGCVAVVPSHRLRRVRAGSGLLAGALWARYQVRRNDPIGLWLHLGWVRMIVLFVPHAAG